MCTFFVEDLKVKRVGATAEVSCPPPVLYRFSMRGSPVGGILQSAVPALPTSRAWLQSPKSMNATYFFCRNGETDQERVDIKIRRSNGICITIVGPMTLK